MTEAPKVYCPKDKEEVPIWYCLGSYMQGRKPCSEMPKSVVFVRKDFAKVDCGWLKNNEEKSTD